jgi:hypothetical protein
MESSNIITLPIRVKSKKGATSCAEVKVDAHAGAKISRGEYAPCVKDILSIFDHLKIDPKSRSEFLEMAESLKDQVVGVRIKFKITISDPNP